MLMVETSDHDQRSTDRARWLEDRKASVGGSEAATVMGCNRYETKLALYSRKRGEIPAVETTEAMRVGHHMESYLAARYFDETDRANHDVGAFMIQRRDDLPYMHATLDRMIDPCDGHDLPGVLQLKNVGHYMAKRWADGEIPDDVQVQIQHEMFVSKMEWGSVAALLSGNEFVWQDVDPHERFCAALANACKAFMNAVREGVPPVATAGDGEVVRLLYPTTSKGKTIVLPDEAIELTEIINSWGLIIKGNIEMVAGAKARLLQLIGDAETAEVPGGNGAWTCKTVKKKAYDVKASETRQLRRK